MNFQSPNHITKQQAKSRKQQVDFYSFTEFNNLAVGVTLAGAIRENGFPSIIGIVSQA